VTSEKRVRDTEDCAATSLHVDLTQENDQ